MGDRRWCHLVRPGEPAPTQGPEERSASSSVAERVARMTNYAATGATCPIDRVSCMHDKIAPERPVLRARQDRDESGIHVPRVGLRATGRTNHRRLPPFSLTTWHRRGRRAPPLVPLKTTGPCRSPNAALQPRPHNVLRLAGRRTCSRAGPSHRCSKTTSRPAGTGGAPPRSHRPRRGRPHRR